MLNININLITCSYSGSLLLVLYNGLGYTKVEIFPVGKPKHLQKLAKCIYFDVEVECFNFMPRGSYAVSFSYQISRI